MGHITQGKVQTGKEVTHGTPVPATAILAGEYSATWGEDRNIDQPMTQRGSYAQNDAGEALGVLGSVQMRGTLNFEDFIFTLLGGIKGGVTPTADAGSPVAQTWVIQPTLYGTADDPLSLTMECGDDTICEKMEYAIVRDFSFTWGIQRRTEITVNYFGRQFTPGSFTASLTNRQVESAIGQMWTLFFDDTGGTVGTTAYTGCMRAGTFNSGPLYIPFHCIDGNKYFNTHKRAVLRPELRMTLTVDSALVALRTKWRADTRQLIRLKNTGSLIHTTPNVNKSIQVDMAGRLLSVGPIGGASDENIQTAEVVIGGEEDITAALLMKFTVINKVAAAP